MVDRSEEGAAGTGPLGAPSLLGPIHAFGSGCFFVFGLLYLLVIDSGYMFASNAFFGALSAANWFVVPRSAALGVRATTFLTIVYLGLVNVAVHVGADPMPMVFWGMSIAIAASFLYGLAGALAWVGLALAFFPLTAWLKAGLLADRVIPLDPFQHGFLSAASYAGLLVFLGFTFALFRRRLDGAMRALGAQADDLRKSEAFLAESQRVARVGTYDFDVKAGAWTSSPLLDQILGIDAAYRRDVAGWLGLVHPDDRAAMKAYLEADVLGGTGLFDRQYRLLPRADGRDVWVHGRGLVHRDSRGRPRRMVGTIQDVSSTKFAEEERRVLETRLFHAQKLESLGVLAGGIAHDFNNLLTGILGNVTLARSVLPRDRDDLATALHQAETAALRAAELTHQMLAFAGKGKFVVQTLDLNQTLSEMVDLLKSSLPRKVAFRLELAPEAPRILADASQVRQVVMNLMINAAEAMGDEPGVVTVRTGVRHVDAAQLAAGFSAGGLDSGEYACIEVADTGCGMDEETRARLFDPFFTTKFTGRGLGLAAVLGIVKGHGGAIWLDTAPGKGTVFTLLFPRAPAEALPASLPARPALPEAVSGRILVVDDEAVVRNLVRAVLEKSGFEVLGADDGASGLEVVRTLGPGIDLVMLDLTMPRMSGVEALAELRRLRPNLRVVVMSGYTRGNVQTLFTDPVPDDFLEKPFHHEDLLAVVRRALRR